MAEQRQSIRGPWVNVAMLCESYERPATMHGLLTGGLIAVSTEALNVKHFEVDSEPLLLILKLVGGEPGQTVQIRIDTAGADGETRPGPTTVTERFEGPMGALQLQIRLIVVFWGEQLYWFNVMLNSRLATRVPFEVRYTYEPPGRLIRP